MNLTKDFLEEQYQKFGKSGYRIAKELNVRKYVVDNAITKFKIKRRSLLVARLPNGSSGKTGYKWCGSCMKDKPIKDFSKGNARFGLDSYCKSCASIKAKRFFPERNKKRQLIKAKLIIDFGNKCSRCGVSDLPISVFVFHHHTEKMGDKTYISPSTVITSKKSTLILSEKSKWSLLCANCHSIVHSHCKLSATKFGL